MDNATWDMEIQSQDLLLKMPNYRKKYDGNKVNVSLNGYYPIPGHVSNAKATLIYDGTKWVIDEFDNWF